MAKKGDCRLTVYGKAHITQRELMYDIVLANSVNGKAKKKVVKLKIPAVERNLNVEVGDKVMVEKRKFFGEDPNFHVRVPTKEEIENEA